MNLIKSTLLIAIKNATGHISSSTSIILWIVTAIFIAIALVSYVLSYIFYRKRSIESKTDITASELFEFSHSKSKNWWIKYRTSGFFCLGILFTMLAIGGIIFITSY
ncbi:MPN207a family PTS transporter accessory protein [Mycoplasmoides pirum]|uniref:MPN207a family PTS transporter accessory protein n=1 Tax=Mycoplasmoides pirum TaxID=2122 RepID=UPI0004830850|nr:hypothetical protein [Mycoplasmoides pirum]